MVDVIVTLFYSLLSDPAHLDVLFALGAFGSILPDFDSDSGLSFYLTFGAATLAFGGVVLYHTLSGHPQNNYLLVVIPLAALIGFWFIVEGARFTPCVWAYGTCAFRATELKRPTVPEVLDFTVHLGI